VYYNENLFVKVTALGRDLEHGNAEGEPIEWEGGGRGLTSVRLLLGVAGNMSRVE
jgi:hypothetical protein